MYWILLVNFLDILWWLDDPPFVFSNGFVCGGNIPSFAIFHREDPDEADEDDDDEDDDDKEEGQSWARNRGRFGVYDDGTVEPTGQPGNQFWTTWLMVATQIRV